MATRKKPAPETPEAKTEAREVSATVTRPDDIDRVAAVSRRADGSPDQTPDFEVLVADETPVADED